MNHPGLLAILSEGCTKVTAGGAHAALEISPLDRTLTARLGVPTQGCLEDTQTL